MTGRTQREALRSILSDCRGPVRCPTHHRPTEVPGHPRAGAPDTQARAGPWNTGNVYWAPTVCQAPGQVGSGDPGPPSHTCLPREFSSEQGSLARLRDFAPTVLAGCSVCRARQGWGLHTLSRGSLRTPAWPSGLCLHGIHHSCSRLVYLCLLSAQPAKQLRGLSVPHCSPGAWRSPVSAAGAHPWSERGWPHTRAVGSSPCSPPGPGDPSNSL